MKIQEIAISNNQKKKLLKAVNDESVLYQEENGDLVVSVATYESIKKNGLDSGPIEVIIGDDVLELIVTQGVYKASLRKANREIKRQCLRFCFSFIKTLYKAVAFVFRPRLPVVCVNPIVFDGVFATLSLCRV